MDQEEYTQNDYRRLGERIRAKSENISSEDLTMLQHFRTTYREPLSIVFNELEQMAHRVDPNCVCAYRVKRIESIVSKLKRLPDMKLDRVGDIAGCRCIMRDINCVYALCDKLRESSKFEIKGKIRDYNKEPNPKDPGYKSIHLYACVGKRSVEIQIRTLQQHAWATLVEISDLIYHLRIKEDGCTEENKDLFDFHVLLSHPQLNTYQKQQMADVLMKYNYLERIGNIFGKNCLMVRQEWNKKNVGNKQFVLIATDKEGVPDFSLYETYNEAEKAYFELYTNNREGKNIVLSHIADRRFDKVSIAYSNYFMTYNSILFHTHHLMANLVFEFYQKNDIKKFKKYYEEYLRTIIVWYKVWKTDLLAFNQENNKTGRKRTQAKDEWYYSIKLVFNNTISLLDELNERLKPSWSRWHIYHNKKNMYTKFVKEIQLEGIDINYVIKQARLIYPSLNKQKNNSRF